jgi:hypothetical protein
MIMANKYIITSNGVVFRTNDLCHYGVKGMKWGVRRYQNADGTLTAAGKKRQQKLVASDREAAVVKGTTLYRVSDSGKSDTSDGKIYVTASKEAADFYVNALGRNKIYKTGKAYAHEYIAKTDLKMPDKRTMEKIELGLLKDKTVQKELVDSLMKKGMSREQATAQVAPYNAGKAFVEKIGNVSVGSFLGALYGVYPGVIATAGNPIGVAAGAGVGAVLGGGALAAVPTAERTRALNVARISYGDKNNKAINDALVKELSKKGYNAMKDYNDRRAFGTKADQAIIVFDSNKNLKTSRISEINSKDYAKAYARNYLKQHPKSKLDFDDLLKDGESEYKRLYESGVIAREREKENKRLLENAKDNQ